MVDEQIKQPKHEPICYREAGKIEQKCQRKDQHLGHCKKEKKNPETKIVDYDNYNIDIFDFREWGSREPLNYIICAI